METEDVVIEEQKTFLFDEKVKIRDEMRQLKTYKSAVVGRDGETLGTVGFAHDVTDIWNTHEEFRTLISVLPIPVLLVTAEYKYLSSNSSFDDMIKSSDGEFSGIVEEEFEIKQFSGKYFNKDIHLQDNVTLTTIDVSLRMSSGEKIFLVEKSPIFDVFKKLTGFFYFFRDVTSERQYEDKLKQQAEIDELTQMNNRKIIKRFFNDDSNEGVYEQLTVIMMDIDFFKKYNDYYGHLAGDEVIKTLADILKSFDNGKDLLAARFGGEEFTIISHGRPMLEIEFIISKIIDELKEKNIPHIKSDIADRVTISVGGVYYDKLAKSSDIQKVMAGADLNLYEAKNSGRNKYILRLDNSLTAERNKKAIEKVENKQ